MKKITKTNLQGLRQLFPVLGKEEMRCHVGGNSDGYYGNDWFNHGYGGYDPDGNYHWHGGYTKDEFDNWEGPWYGGWVYGLGYVHLFCLRIVCLLGYLFVYFIHSNIFLSPASFLLM